MVISTYQAASGAGQAAMDELELQTKEALEGKEITKNIFPFQVLAVNPQRWSPAKCSPHSVSVFLISSDSCMPYFVGSFLACKISVVTNPCLAQHAFETISGKSFQVQITVAHTYAVCAVCLQPVQSQQPDDRQRLQ